MLVDVVDEIIFFQLSTSSLVQNYMYPLAWVSGQAMWFALANGILVDLMGRGALNVPVQCGSSSCCHVTFHKKNMPCVAVGPTKNNQTLGSDFNPACSPQPNPAEPGWTHRSIKQKTSVSCGKPLRFWGCYTAKTDYYRRLLVKFSTYDCLLSCRIYHSLFVRMNEMMSLLQFYFKITLNTSMMKSICPCKIWMQVL